MNPSELIIPGIVVIAACWGFGYQLWSRRRYGLEMRNLKRVEDALSSIDGGLIDELITRSSVGETSVVGHRLCQVRNIANSPAPPSVADLSAADIERDDARFESGLPNTLISILLILGLAGTLLSFKDIMADFPQGTESTVEIKKWMNDAYPAFGTAFLASLVGITGTVVLLIHRAFVHNRRSDLFDCLDRFTAGSLYSRFVEPDATDAKTLILAGQQLLQTAGSFDKSVDKMATFPKSLTASAGGLSEATTEMRDALGNAATTFEEFKAGFSETGDVRKSLVRLESSVIAFAQHTELATGVLRDAVSGAASILHGTANSVKQTGDSIGSVGGKLAAASENMERNIAQFLTGNTAHAAKMDALIQALGGIVETTNRNQREWSEAIVPTIRAVTEIAGRLEASMSPLNAQTDALVKAGNQMEQAASQLSSTGETQLKQFGDFLTTKVGEVFTESTAIQKDFVNKLATELTAAGNAQVERLRTSAATIDRATAQASSSHRGFLTELEPALKELPDLARQQTAMLSQLAEIGSDLRLQMSKLGLIAPPKKSKWQFWK